MKGTLACRAVLDEGFDSFGWRGRAQRELAGLGIVKDDGRIMSSASHQLRDSCGGHFTAGHTRRFLVNGLAHMG